MGMFKTGKIDKYRLAVKHVVNHKNDVKTEAFFLLVTTINLKGVGKEALDNYFYQEVKKIMGVLPENFIGIKDKEINRILNRNNCEVGDRLLNEFLEAHPEHRI